MVIHSRVAAVSGCSGEQYRGTPGFGDRARKLSVESDQNPETSKIRRLYPDKLDTISRDKKARHVIGTVSHSV